MFYFLQTSCVPCFRELQVLERIRDRYRDSAGLVAIFHDTGGGKVISDYLLSIGIEPDFILTDPDFLNRRHYDFQSLPVLIVAGPDGKIVFTRKGFRSGEARPLANDLDSLFRENTGGDTRTPFKEARRIHGEALEYYDSGRAGLAAVYWERALEIFPDASSLHACLADAYGLLGRPRDSAREYARYLSARPLAYDRVSIRSRIRAILDSSP
jgi:tetratricopeptide (TPR) repeat protein